MFIGASGLKVTVYGGYGATVPTGSLGQHRLQRHHHGVRRAGLTIR